MATFRSMGRGGRPRFVEYAEIARIDVWTIRFVFRGDELRGLPVGRQVGQRLAPLIVHKDVKVMAGAASSHLDQPKGAGHLGAGGQPVRQTAGSPIEEIVVEERTLDVEPYGDRIDSRLGQIVEEVGPEGRLRRRPDP